jgi:hypothetical protein
MLTDARSGMTKLIVAFRNFMKAPKNASSRSKLLKYMNIFITFLPIKNIVIVATSYIYVF